MKIVTADEMRAIDRATSERFGVPSLTLMENAGTAVANFVLCQYAAAKNIGLICGKGNNGGDGFVAARKLQEAGRRVLALLLCSPDELRGDAAVMFSKMPIQPALAASVEELKGESAERIFRCDVLVDAILGTGFRPPVTGLYAEAITRLQKVNVPIVAVDIPSGLDADAMDDSTGPSAIAPASACVTFTAPRPAHVFCPHIRGPVVIAAIGSPEQAITSDLNLEMTTVHDIAPCVAPRSSEAHKGNFGHVLVVGGSLGKSGAAAMAGMAALRAGAGLVTVATPKSILPIVASFAPEIMTEPLPETDEGTISGRLLEDGHWQRILQGKTMLAIGPGISRNSDTAEFVRKIVRESKLPIVLDADGLNAFEGRAAELKGKPVVITPHPGEMARLTGLSTKQIQEDRIGTVRRFATEHQIIAVLKGHRTLIAEPSGRVWVNVTGNPGMASGGMGDILTGLVAGMLAQFPGDQRMAVAAAVHLHGLAADIACRQTGEHSLVATDLLRALPDAFRQVRDEATQKVVRFHA